MGAACNCSKSPDDVKGAVVQAPPRNQTASEEPASELAVYFKENTVQMHKKVIELYKAALAQTPPALSTLKLATFKAKEKDWTHILTLLPHCPQLQRLHFWKVTISEKSLDALGDLLGNLKQLDYLMLGDMNLASWDLNKFKEGLKGLGNLRELVLTVNYLTADHLAVLLPGLLMLKRLEYLSLDENELGNKGADIVAVLLEKLARLYDVSLKFNSISRKGLLAVLPCISRKPRSIVRMDGNDLNDDEYDMLDHAIARTSA